MGLTAAQQPFSAEEASDPQRLAIALALLPVTALLFWTVAFAPIALLAAAPSLWLLARLSWPARRYFIAFSPRNAFPRNLPVLARWAALYSAAMLIMIVVPPLPDTTRWAIWLLLAGLCLGFPLLKAWLRSRRVWSV